MSEPRTVTVAGREFGLPYADLLPALRLAERAALKDDIRRHGVTVPVIIDDEDMVIDGANRLEIAAELEAETGEPADVPFIMIEGLSDEDRRERALDLNVNRRQLTPAELEEARRRRVRRVIQAHFAGQSTREIAERERVSQPQVLRDLRDANTPPKPSGDTPVSPDTSPQPANELRTIKPELEDSGTREQAAPVPAPKPRKVQGRDGKVYDADKPKRKSPRKGKKPGRKKGEGKSKPAVVLDGLGNPVPHQFADVFSSSMLAEEVILIEGKVKVYKAAMGWAVWLEPEILERVRDVARLLANAIPYVVCLACEGAGDKCPHCRTSGHMSKYVYEAYLISNNGTAKKAGAKK